LSRVEDPEDNSARAAGATQPPSPFDSPSEPNAHESSVQESSVHESSVHESLTDESSAQESSAPDSSIHELLQSTREALARESEQPKGRFGVSIGTIVAVAVSAVVALLLVILISGVRQSDTASSLSVDVQQFKAALSSQSKDREKQDQQAQDRQQQDQPPSKEPAKPTTEQFQRLFASSGKPATPPDRESSDKLLQRFMQWRQKTGSAENAQ
jgi:hypothetical protein